MSLFNELKRRNVFKVAVAYVITAWLLMQIGEVMAPALHLPDWVLSALAFFLILGFPVVLIFAWAFELTPEGLRRESDVDRDSSVTSKTGRKLDFVIIAVLVVAVAVLLFERRDQQTPEPTEAADATPTIDAPTHTTEASPTTDLRKAIAVLPFHNLSAHADNAYFAAGVHEDILTYLSRVDALRVNSRTSVQKYAETTLNLREVAAELGARFIVEGSVRRAGNQVRVTAQLIDADTDEHLWAENFDRELTDIFAIQTQVAQEIVSALEAELSPGEAELLESRPTDSIEAYDLYLMARHQLSTASGSATDSEDEVRLLEQAVAIDPSFSRAWALLAVAHGETYWFLSDRTAERLAKMKTAVDRALAEDPELPEGLMAKAAYHYRGFYEYEEALKNFERARQLTPADPIVHYNIGLTLRRLGRYDESIDALLETTRLAPAYTEAWAEALSTAINSGRIERALAIETAIPDEFRSVPRLVGNRASLRLFGQGDVEGAAALLARYPVSDDYYDLYARYSVALAQNRFREAADLAMNPSFLNTIAAGMGTVAAALALELGGFEDDAHALRTTAADVLETALEQPYAETYAWPHLAQAQNLVRMAEPESAVASCDRAMKIMPLDKDKIHGAEIAESCAWVKAQAGRVDEAIDILERTRPFYSQGPWSLALMPEWGFLKDNPKFMALAETSGATGR